MWSGPWLDTTMKVMLKVLCKQKLHRNLKILKCRPYPRPTKSWYLGVREETQLSVFFEFPRCFQCADPLQFLFSLNPLLRRRRDSYMSKEMNELQKPMYINVLNKGASICKGANIPLWLFSLLNLNVLIPSTLKKIFCAALPSLLQNT